MVWYLNRRTAFGLVCDATRPGILKCNTVLFVLQLCCLPMSCRSVPKRQARTSGFEGVPVAQLSIFELYHSVGLQGLNFNKVPTLN